jgi:hypothetical protein
LYRSLWAIIIVATVPWLKPEFFEPISQPSIRIWYALLPLVVFIPMCVAAALEYADLKSVQEKLADLRSTHPPLSGITGKRLNRQHVGHQLSS